MTDFVIFMIDKVERAKSISKDNLSSSKHWTLTAKTRKQFIYIYSKNLKVSAKTDQTKPLIKALDAL